ncbi:MAG TPA: cell wall-binding repeat-containing protein, partial [Gallicola sp.]|nr:cell wall-binding repeat-containing protein [Gallicola sp.]
MKKRLFKIIISVVFVLGMVFPKISLANERDLNISRISGADRYETAVEVSRKTFPKGSKYVIVASGEDFPDALVGGTLATQIEAPILLISKNSLPNLVRNEIKRLEVETIYLLGGTGTIGEKVENDIGKLAVTIKRLAGKDRLETAVAISKERDKLIGNTSPGGSGSVASINAYNFADSLSSAPFIGQMIHKNLYYNNITSLMPYGGWEGSYMVIGGLESV